MSNTDSFIDEVTEEVRRDRLYGYLRRYGWIAVLAVVLIVGGAAWNEWRKAQAQAEARALGDGVLAALEAEEGAARAEALGQLAPGSADAAALVTLLRAAELGEAGETEAAVELLDSVATDGAVSQVYRDMAGFKALLHGSQTLEPAARRQGFEAMAAPGNPMRLLAEEQLALIDLETGDREAALARLNAILEDAEATAGLRQRASQLIVALGGSLDAEAEG